MMHDRLPLWSLNLVIGLASGLSLSVSAQPAAPPPATAPAEDPAMAVIDARISPWKPIFVGVDMCKGSTRTPRPVQMRAIRVDLREPTIDLLVTPSNGDQPKDVNARTPSEFLSEFKCQAAINGSFFDVFATRPADPQDIVGLSISRGDLYSPPNKFDALLISKDRRAWIDPAPIDTRGAYNALSGDTTLLIKGRYSLPADDRRAIVVKRHPRSTVGISRDGRYLILMTIDGRQPGYSEGATKPETAEWLKKLGAWDALNLDGGGSTALVIEGDDGKPEVLNRPCGPPVGGQRRVANHLGVFAKRLPGSRTRSTGG